MLLIDQHVAFIRRENRRHDQDSGTLGVVPSVAVFPTCRVWRGALVQGLTAANTPLVDEVAATRVITGDLLSYETHGMTQGFTGVITEDRMFIRVTVRDAPTGHSRWSDTLQIASSATSHGGPMADRILRNSLDELLNRLLTEEDSAMTLCRIAA